MNTAMPAAVSRLARASAQLIELSHLNPAARQAAERYSSRPTNDVGAFVRKCTDEEFLSVIPPSPAEATTAGEITARAREKLHISVATVHRLLCRLCDEGKIVKVSRFYHLPAKAGRAKVASREPSVSAPAPAKATGEGMVETTIELTPVQSSELAMFARAMNCPVATAIHVLAASRLEMVLHNSMPWEEEMRNFRKGRDAFVKHRSSVVRKVQRENQASDCIDRIESLRTYTTSDN